MPGVEAIIAVASGKGGVGKSTTAVNLALGLAALGLRVGILDADIYGPSLPKLLAIKERPQTLGGTRLKPITRYGLTVMSIGFLIDEETPMIWRGPMVISALTQMLREVEWGTLDVMVVDMPPGTGDAQLTMAQQVPLKGAVIVSTPQDLALIDARRGIAMFKRVNVPVLGVIENMSYFLCPHCGTRSDIFSHGGARHEAERLGVPFLGEVPLHMTIREKSDAGLPVVATEPDGPHAKIYRDIAAKVRDQLKGGARRSRRAEDRDRGLTRRGRTAVRQTKGHPLDSRTCAIVRTSEGECSPILRRSRHLRKQQIGERFRDEVELGRFALAGEQLPSRCVEIEQELALRRIAHEAPRPADRGEPCAACHGADAMERGGGIGDEGAGLELESLLARCAVDDELAAVVARCVGQEQGERHIGAHATHQRVVDVAAVLHAGAHSGRTAAARAPSALPPGKTARCPECVRPPACGRSRASDRIPPACRLFLTVRAAKPAVACPSMKRARSSAARTALVSSAERTLAIAMCIRFSLAARR